MRLIDVEHLGHRHVIGCWAVRDVIVDPGPESSLQTLVAALGDERPRAVLLTHIHLDHAGGTGALLERWPDLEVYVHERGAPHLADPSKLLSSAERLYGDAMERLWGRVAPVPEGRIHPLSGGEEVHGFRVEYTPGMPPTTSPISTMRAVAPSSATSPRSASSRPTSSSLPPHRRTSTSSSGAARST